MTVPTPLDYSRSRTSWSGRFRLMLSWMCWPLLGVAVASLLLSESRRAGWLYFASTAQNPVEKQQYEYFAHICAVCSIAIVAIVLADLLFIVVRWQRRRKNEVVG